jgi:hypothetical protein
MPKRPARVDSGPAQPMLPSVNLARLIVDESDSCDCECAGCPPWDHRSSECVFRCVQQVDWSVQRGVPPQE